MQKGTLIRTLWKGIHSSEIADKHGALLEALKEVAGKDGLEALSVIEEEGALDSLLNNLDEEGAGTTAISVSSANPDMVDALIRAATR